MTSLLCARSPALVRPAVLRSLGCLVVLALLAACAGQGPEISATQQAEQYAAHARGNYIAPGPPGDPWGPYIKEASKRFDVPDLWIRSVMNVESGAQE
ncbi:MAG: murein transglycosylase, partial [Acetobacteraceae bacterium]